MPIEVSAAGRRLLPFLAKDGSRRLFLPPVAAGRNSAPAFNGSSLSGLLRGLGDAQSDAARSRRLALSPGLFLARAPQIIGLSASHGAPGDKITVTLDSPADGLLFLPPPGLLPSMPTGAHVDIENIFSGAGTPSVVFSVPYPYKSGFTWGPGAYDLRAWTTANDNFSPGGTLFTIDEFKGIVPASPRVPYIPAGVTQDSAGNWIVPGAQAWDGRSIQTGGGAPTAYSVPLSIPAGSIASAASVPNGGGVSVNAPQVAVVLENLTRPGLALIVGDQWRLTVTGAANSTVKASATKDGVSFGQNTVMGNTDSAGRLVLTGAMAADSVGAWSESWSVGGQAPASINFTVSPTATAAGAPSGGGGNTSTDSTGGGPTPSANSLIPGVSSSGITFAGYSFTWVAVLAVLAALWFFNRKR